MRMQSFSSQRKVQCFKWPRYCTSDGDNSAGVFLFKVYTNGHPYDTSQVWLDLFTALLKEEVPTRSSLVPALIVPKGYPNQRTWEALRRVQATELTGSLLTCRLDFSPEWRTYYDYRLAASVEWKDEFFLHLPSFQTRACQDWNRHDPALRV